MGKETSQHAVETLHPLERELRLIGDKDVLQAAFDAPALISKAAGDEKTIDLDNRYFDTSDHRLRDKGLALRVRIGSEGTRQTLKAGDDAQSALLSRGIYAARQPKSPVNVPRGMNPAALGCTIRCDHWIACPRMSR